MKVLICGGRDYIDAVTFNREMDALGNRLGITHVVEGGNPSGADRLAYVWAKSKCIPVTEYTAAWTAFGKKAGPIRNRQMLANEEPARVISFPGGDGTRDCVTQARARGIEVIEVKP